MHAVEPNAKIIPQRPAPPRPVPAVLRPPQPQFNQNIDLSKGSTMLTCHNHNQSDSGAIAAGTGGSGLFSSIRGGAGSFLKNLKDTSSKVMQTMQQTIARTDLDISAITSRILVMPCPSEGLESAYKTNNIEDVKLYVESRFIPAKVSVYNLGPRTCSRLPPPVRTIEGSYLYPLAMKAPTLHGMYALAEDMFGFLSVDPKSVIFIQSADNGRGTAATMVKIKNILSFIHSFYFLIFTSGLCASNLCKFSIGTRRCNANFCGQKNTTKFESF